MKPLTKSRAYEVLFRISKKQHIDIDKYIEMLSKSGNTIPTEVILFINKYHSSTIPQLKVFNVIYEKRRNNPLYKTIMSESASIEDQALALNSLITRCLIEMKDLNVEEKEFFIDIMNIEELCDAVSAYFKGDTKTTRRVFLEVRTIFKNLFSDENKDQG